MTDQKITEINVIDDRGEKHTLRCSNGIHLEIEGGIAAITKPPSKKLALYIADGRWIAYRLTYGS